MWSVRRSVAWSLPATGDDFEHDVDGGRGAAVLILSSLFLFWVIIIVWSPSGVHVPWYISIVQALRRSGRLMVTRMTPSSSEASR